MQHAMMVQSMFTLDTALACTITCCKPTSFFCCRASSMSLLQSQITMLPQKGELMQAAPLRLAAISSRKACQRQQNTSPPMCPRPLHANQHNPVTQNSPAHLTPFKHPQAPSPGQAGSRQTCWQGLGC